MGTTGYEHAERDRAGQAEAFAAAAGHGWPVLPTVEVDADDVPIPFSGTTIRVSDCPPDDLQRVRADQGFEVINEDSYAYAPAHITVPPEEQLFLYCRRA